MKDRMDQSGVRKVELVSDCANSLSDLKGSIIAFGEFFISNLFS